MPIYNAPLTKIDKAETRRYAGLRGQTDFPEALLEQACGQALLLAKPRGCWQLYRYEAAAGTIDARPPVILTASGITSHLANAVEIAVLAVTAGPELEQAVAELFAAGEYTLGLLLDAAGTTAAEAATDGVNALIAEQARRRGLAAVSRFSPGYGDWDIAAQPQILRLAGGDSINIAVTPSCMLLPRKSVTAVIGLQPAGEPPDKSCKIADCLSCRLKNCVARKEHNQ